jgi:hypothetical protein
MKPDTAIRAARRRFLNLCLIAFLSVGVLAGSARLSDAQFGMPGLGGGGLQIGRDRPVTRDQPRDQRQIDRGGDRRDHPGDHGMSLGGGLIRGVIGGAIEESLRQHPPEGAPVQPKKPKQERQTKQTKEEPRGKKPKQEPFPPPQRPLGETPVVKQEPPDLDKLLLVLDLPEARDCKDCDEARQRISRMQALLAEEENLILETQKQKAGWESELQDDRLQLAKLSAKNHGGYDPEIAAIMARGLKDRNAITIRQIARADDFIKTIAERMVTEKASLARMLTDYADCLQRHCPPPPPAVVEQPPLPPYEVFRVIPDIWKKTHKNYVDHFKSPGDEVPDGTGDIDCGGHVGRVSVRTGVGLVMKSGREKDNEIAIGYRGTGCDDCYWLQIGWTEILVTRTGQKPVREKMTIPTLGNSHSTTGEDEPPQYFVDTVSLTTPAYEEGGTAVVDKESDTMYDQPNYLDPLRQVAQRVGDVEKIEAVFHFDTFLVCDRRVCAKVHWDAYQSYDKLTRSVTKVDYRNVSRSTTGKPNPEQLQTFNDRFGDGLDKF